MEGCGNDETATDGRKEQRKEIIENTNKLEKHSKQKVERDDTDMMSQKMPRGKRKTEVENTGNGQGGRQHMESDSSRGTWRQEGARVLIMRGSHGANVEKPKKYSVIGQLRSCRGQMSVGVTCVTMVVIAM